MDIKQAAQNFIAAFAASDFATMQSLCAEDLVCYMTNSQGGIDILQGREAFLANLSMLDVKGANCRVNVTQITTVNDGQVLMMVEVKASRNGKDLHNFAAFFLTFREGLIAEYRMVEALPAYSAQFWS